MVYPISCTAVCYVTAITLFIKKVGVVRPNFCGVRTSPTPSGCALASLLHTETVAELSLSSEAASEFEATNARFSLSVSVLMSAPHR